MDLRNYEELKVANANKASTMGQTITTFVEREYPGISDKMDSYSWELTEIPDGLRLSHVEISSSGNEPKVYAHIIGAIPDEDEDMEIIFWHCRQLDNSVEAFANVARLAGAVHNAIKNYLVLNDLS